MEHMRQIAFETVLRACGFASLAIFCVMAGMAFDPKLAFQAGGFLSMVMAFVLVLKWREAATKDHRKTEMWLYIEKDQRPPAASAQWLSSNILRTTYLTFAKWTSAVSVCLWSIALVFSMFGATSTYDYTSTTNSYLPKRDASAPPRDRAAPAIRYQVIQ